MDHGKYTKLVKLCLDLLEKSSFCLSVIELDQYVKNCLDGEEFEDALRHELEQLGETL